MPILPASAIDVHIALDAVIIDGNDGRRDTFLPIVHIRPPRQGTTISLTDFPVPLAVGTERTGEPTIPVPLFTPTVGNPAGYQKGACLGAFFRFAFKRVIDRHLLRVRPVVRVHGVSALNSLLCGYERSILTAAFDFAGAKEVLFVD